MHFVGRIVRVGLNLTDFFSGGLDVVRTRHLNPHTMSLDDLLEEVDRLSDAERTVLSRRLRARELAGDASRTVEMSGRLDRMLAGEGVITEQELRARIEARGAA